MVLLGDRGLPAVLDHDGLMRLDDDGGALHRVAGRKLPAQKDRGLVPFAAGIKPGRALGRGRGRDVIARVGSENFAPPPIASMETASTTSSLLSSMKPKRALCAASNAACIVGARHASPLPSAEMENPGTTSAVSVPE